VPRTSTARGQRLDVATAGLRGSPVLQGAGLPKPRPGKSRDPQDPRSPPSLDAATVTSGGPRRRARPAPRRCRGRAAPRRAPGRHARPAPRRRPARRRPVHDGGAGLARRIGPQLVHGGAGLARRIGPQLVHGADVAALASPDDAARSSCMVALASRDDAARSSSTVIASSRPTSRRWPRPRRPGARRGAGLARRWRGPQLVHGGNVEALASCDGARRGPQLVHRGDVEALVSRPRPGARRSSCTVATSSRPTSRRWPRAPFRCATWRGSSTATSSRPTSRRRPRVHVQLCDVEPAHVEPVASRQVRHAATCRSSSTGDVKPVASLRPHARRHEGPHLVPVADVEPLAHAPATCSTRGRSSSSVTSSRWPRAGHVLDVPQLLHGDVRAGGLARRPRPRARRGEGPQLVPGADVEPLASRRPRPSARGQRPAAPRSVMVRGGRARPRP
jgi:hypothetical protein